MRPPRWLAAGLLVVLLAANGCALFLVGAGAAGGYAVSKDSVRNYFDLPKDHVYQQSLSVIKLMGKVISEDPKRGVIRAKVVETNVTIFIKPITPRTVELRVKARNKLLLPQVDVAQDIYNKIAERLR